MNAADPSGYFSLRDGLDIAGIIPGPIGMLANTISAGVSIYCGDYGRAGMSAMAMIPMEGVLAAGGARLGRILGRGAHAAEEVGQEARAAEESAAALQNGGCFVAGTPVQMADGSSRPIEQIQKGDLVTSRNPATGKAHARRVARTFVHQHAGTLVLTMDTGETIETTPEHPFFKLGVGFVPAASLGIGTSIVTRAGPPTHITNVERKDATATVYNLEVEDDHTYFVGKFDGGVWVHNSCSDRALAAAERHGGINQGGGNFQYPTRGAARRAASEIAGDLGSSPESIRLRDFRGAPWNLRSSERVIGRQTPDGATGWRDDFLGHPQFNMGPHVNAWGEGMNFHLYY